MKAKYTPEEWAEKVAKAKKTPVPGPWYVRESENRIYIQSDATPYAVAEINTATMTGHNDMVNAALIAAAPYLLHELKYTVAAIERWGSEHPECGGWIGVIHGAKKAIRAAEGCEQ